MAATYILQVENTRIWIAFTAAKELVDKYSLSRNLKLGISTRCAARSFVCSYNLKIPSRVVYDFKLQVTMRCKNKF